MTPGPRTESGNRHNPRRIESPFVTLSRLPYVCTRTAPIPTPPGRTCGRISRSRSVKMNAVPKMQPSRRMLAAFEDTMLERQSMRAAHKGIVAEQSEIALKKMQSVKNLGQMLSRQDTDGNGKLEYHEIASAVQSEETSEYLKSQGMKDAMALMARLDSSGSGNIDAAARRDFIRGLCPDLKDEVYKLRSTGEYTASGVLHNQRKDFIEGLKLDHKKEVVSLQAMFAGETKTVTRNENDYFGKRVDLLHQSLLKHWDVQEHYLDEVCRKKILLFMSTKETTRNPTDPITPKYTHETFELKALLRNLSVARHPTPFQLKEGERHKLRLYELEDEAVSRHATYQPKHFKLQALALKKDLRLIRAKFAQLRWASFDSFEKHVGQARGMLTRRHVVYDQRQTHAHAMELHTTVLENLRPVRKLNPQPEINSYKPTMQHLNKNGGNLDRVANGLGGYHLRELERTGGAPQHVLRASASGPPVVIDPHTKRRKK